ncbi:hypothetical protein BCT31_01870 [Vibrio lentus]|uniref:hypothetical protein n=1 Tax=Vibrio lentus TaxID=136468 RepID=UPI000CC22EF8|nr:hypothetical protein [Vibrio lentus]PMN54323.1 hypothetical protein BCT31_01870 [Vibrio lentus]
MTSTKLFKAIRFFYRQVNFTHRSTDRPKALRSIKHSLRVAADKTKKLEWLPEFASENRIWLPLYGVLPLARIKLKDRESLAQFIAPQPRIANKTRLQAQLSDSKRKLKKSLKSEESNGNTKIALVLSHLIEHPRDKAIKLDIKRVAKLNMKRQSQRLRAIERYISVHNQLVATPVNENNVCVQEGVLKIPHQWDICTDIVSADEYIEITRGFLECYFPEYPINAIVYHHDERQFDSQSGWYTDTGAHTHYYLSARNKETKQYDLNKAQVRVVNAFMKKSGAKVSLLTENLDEVNLTRKQSQLFGEYFQKMLYDYVNEHLLAKKGLKAVFAPESVRRSAQRQHMNEQAKQPKNLREFNLLHMNTQSAKKHLKELEHRLKFLKRVVDDTEEVAAQNLSSVLKDVYVRTYCTQKGFDREAAKYLLKVSQATEKHLSLEMKELLHKVAVELDDKDLAYQLKPPA